MAKGSSAAASVKTKKRKTFWIFFLITFILGTGAFAYVSNLVKNLGETQIFGETEVSLLDDMEPIVDPDSIYYEAFQDKNRINMLLLGVNDGLTDTIMVASFDLDAKHVDLVSVPRDTYFHREGYNGDAENKINAAYRGEVLNSAYAVSEVLLGMPLHCYAIVDYKGIETIVDEMGGVPMNIPFRMKYSDPTDKPPLYIDIPEGQQTLDGDHAVQFLRYRKGYSEGDIGRVKAQQEFMKSAFKQLLSQDLVKMAKVIQANIDSDITVKMAAEMATRAIGISAEDIETYVMPHTLQGHAPWYVYPDETGLMEMIDTIYSIEPEVPEGQEGNGEGDTANEEN